MLTQYLRLPVTGKDALGYIKTIHQTKLKAKKANIEFRYPKPPLGRPIGCAVVIPVYEEEDKLESIFGFCVGWALYHEVAENTPYSKENNKEVAIGRARRRTLYNPEGKLNCPNSLESIIFDLISRAKIYYKTENIINIGDF